MEHFSMLHKSHRIIRFVSIQLVALLGWIVVQSYFSLSPLGHTLPFVLTVFIEAVWWSGLLFVMFLLFLLEYRRFVQAAVDLEETNRRLRLATNQLLQRMRSEHTQEEPVNASGQDANREA